VIARRTGWIEGAKVLNEQHEGQGLVNVCRLCASQRSGETIWLEELMFGTGERFSYFRCEACRCLQIAEAPTSMEPYYPPNYYSFSEDNVGVRTRLKRRIRDALSFYGSSRLFSGRAWWERGDFRSLRDSAVSPSERILDLGCGAGEFVASLGDLGFTNVVGADPFISHDITHPNGVRIRKSTASDLKGAFDVVMMHHSLEHIWDQQESVRQIARLLAPGGRCIIRIPTIDSWAWEEYGKDWVQLDPPRHFYLHSRQSIRELVENAGMEVVSVVDDSMAFQILGSEKVRGGHALLDPGTNAMDYVSYLPAETLKSAAARSRQLNREGRGDSIAVHARKP
jgi:SAM-dependent methyltransferase